MIYYNIFFDQLPLKSDIEALKIYFDNAIGSVIDGFKYHHMKTATSVKYYFKNSMKKFLKTNNNFDISINGFNLVIYCRDFYDLTNNNIMFGLHTDFDIDRPYKYIEFQIAKNNGIHERYFIQKYNSATINP